MQLGTRLPVQAAPGQTYGVAGQQRAAQRAVPLTRAATPPAASPVASVAAPPAPLDAPTALPGEPVTTGSAFGAGPGPEVLAAAPDTRVAALGYLNSIGDRLSPALRHLRDTLGAQESNQGTP